MVVLHDGANEQSVDSHHSQYNTFSNRNETSIITGRTLAVELLRRGLLSVSVSHLFAKLLDVDTSSNKSSKVRTSLLLPRKRNAALEAFRPTCIAVVGVFGGPEQTPRWCRGASLEERRRYLTDVATVIRFSVGLLIRP